MLTELQENLEAILEEKNTKILPGNIKSGVTIFNIAGTVTAANEEPSRDVTITSTSQTFTPVSGYTGMSEINVTGVSASVDSNIQAGNIREGVSILNVTGNARIIPDGIFVQITSPTKTTDQAIWLQESTVTSTSFIGNIPNAVLQWADSGNRTVAEFILALNSTTQTNIDSYKQHLLFISGATIYLVASDTLYYDPSNNATVTFDSTERVFVTYTSSGVVDYTSDSSVTTTQMLTANNKYTDKNIYSTDGTKVTVKAYVDSTNYLSIEVDNKKYEVQVNKGSQFNKILDTADGDITANDVRTGKIGYSNNTKIVGTFAGVDSSDATANAVDICAGKTAYINNVKVTGTGAMTFATVNEMNLVTTVPEDTLAIVYGATYVGTYRFDHGSWTEIGSASTEQQMMNNLNALDGSTEQYEGLGGTEEEINEVFDEILGNEEE